MKEDGILNELLLIKEAAEEAVSASGDPIVTDWLTGVATQAAGYIDQLTPRAAATEVKFAEAPAQQQPIEAAPSQVEAEGTADAPAANADVGGAEDEPLPEVEEQAEAKPDPPTQPTSRHTERRHR